MVNSYLVLSIFPGIDLLGRAFEEAGYCVVRGPDLLWGGDIYTFHPPAGVFAGVIGGPPCKGESKARQYGGLKPLATLSHEFDRIVQEAAPDWWVMEAVIKHEAPYVVKLSPRWLGEKQSRRRYFHSNHDLEPYLEPALFEHPVFKHAVTAANRAGKQGTVQRKVHSAFATYSFREMCELQGLPAGFELGGFTMKLKYEVVGNGVPLSMGRQIARAVEAATRKEK